MQERGRLSRGHSRSHVATIYGFRCEFVIDIFNKQTSTLPRASRCVPVARTSSLASFIEATRDLSGKDRLIYITCVEITLHAIVLLVTVLIGLLSHLSAFRFACPSASLLTSQCRCTPVQVHLSICVHYGLWGCCRSLYDHSPETIVKML